MPLLPLIMSDRYRVEEAFFLDGIEMHSDFLSLIHDFAELLGFSPRSQECMARIFSFCYVDQMKKFQLQISISDEIFFFTSSYLNKNTKERKVC